MTAVHPLQCIGDLSHGGLRPGGIDGQCHQIVVQTRPHGLSGCPGELSQGRLHGSLITFRTKLLQFGELLGPHPAVLHLENIDIGVLVDLILVHTDHRLLSGVDSRLGSRRRLLDAQLGNAIADRLRHSPTLGHLGDVRASALRQLMGQPFDVVRASPRVDGPGGAGLLLQQKLGVPCDTR